MKRSTKALLLSAFAYPGAGHWYLEKKLPAILLIAASIAAFYVLMSGMWTQTNLLAEQIVSGEVQFEVGAVLDLMTAQNNPDQSNSITTATAWMGIIWVVAVVDTWRLGRTKA
ncbi:hypothetical protein [Granulosicoccus antarcticus]|uniref:DUF5683 domain-containing protein n=1 Tax=Granulosicoccus antarcticus IMCC3135 TaxID=1192854 RepID=A0A2Z2NSJ0_9GAMM|nr:hypothetical protein [Granulosicoccus antarcticus]ASJ72981.1 hypothetical protein IMCC3135_14480 [Granulosicoccus antarcticus IMCC3135]